MTTYTFCEHGIMVYTDNPKNWSIYPDQEHDPIKTGQFYNEIIDMRDRGEIEILPKE